MKRVVRFNPRYREYLDYLNKHIGGVIRAWEDVLRPALEEADDQMVLDQVDLDKLGLQVYNHDRSKYDSEEFNGYCNHWYPQDGSEVEHTADRTSDDASYDYAWSHHQHNNPHHSQYWLIVKDDGEVQALDIPMNYILEMLCDWHSFSQDPGENTAYDWWMKNRDRFIMSDATIANIDHCIEYLKTPLCDL